jgi:hypothetical protein
MGTSSTNRHRPSFFKYPEYVVPTSIKNGRHSISKTTKLQRLSDDEEEIAASLVFRKRLFGMLVLQYSTILFLASPFALLDPLKASIRNSRTLYVVLECINLFGIVSTITVAIARGSQYPVTFICLSAITFFVAVEFGISFAVETVGAAGFIAIGQATTSFALILALLQFDLDWLNYSSAFGVSLVASLVWMMLLLEMGEHTILASLGIGFGGFVFVTIVLFSSFSVENHVSPDEYVLGTLFILCPEALLYIGGIIKRRVDTSESLDDEPEVVGERDRLLRR